MSKVYLTCYEEYPIYEPAEGGYYYSGQDYSEYYECESIEEAKEILLKLKPELEEYGFNVWEDGAYYSTRYIGEGIHWIIEDNLGEHKRGYEPYC